MERPEDRTLASIRSMIDAIEFHDLPVHGIHFGLEEKRIALIVSKVNEHSDENDLIEVLFSNTCELTLEDRNLLTIEEIYGYDLSSIGQRYRIRIVFLTGHSRPSLTMEFCFDDLTVQQLVKLT